MMLRGWTAVAVVGGLMPVMAWAQTHAVKKPETVVRAVAVYEWTGDEAKPTASRVVPVSVFINGQLEDGGVYLARPVPFELDPGTVFEVQKAGAPLGTLDLAYDRHYVSNGGGPGGAMQIDDGWLAYGPFKPIPKDTYVASAKKNGPVAKVVVSGGSGPHFSNSGSSDKTADNKPVDRSTAAGGGTTVSAANDPDAPTMRRRDTSTDGDSAKDDVDRPTLKKRTPEEQKAAQKKASLASVTGAGDLNDDPDRPNLHRGKPSTRMDEEDIPPLKGLPADMQQRVAVSDAKDRPEHVFERLWESDSERAEVTLKMEAMAREELGKYDVPAPPPAVVTPAPVAAVPVPPKPKPGATPAQLAAYRRAVAKAAAAAKAAKAAAAAAPPPPPTPMTNEALKGYTLSYGGAATYVFSASSPGVGGVTRYVTVVAQREPLGELKVAMTNVTDSTHLDRTPWMRLVDVVDAEASNRASLLFELRARTSRQFALYRVIGAEAQQTFVTAPPGE